MAEGHGRVLLAAGPAADPAIATAVVAAVATRSAAAPAPVEDMADAVSASSPSAELMSVESGTNVWPDENAEAAFIAEARQRGEPVAATTATRETMDEKEDDKKALPALADLMGRLSPEVRETLDELFRARFTTVRRVPKKVLKAPGARP